MGTMFDSFRKAQQLDKEVQDIVAAQFIDNGSMATTIDVNGQKYQVGFVYSTNPQKPDYAHLYTKENVILSVGTTFTWETTNEHELRHYIIIDLVPSVKRIQYHEYQVYECNVEIDGNYGYFIKTAANYINTKIIANMMEVSMAKPLLIMGTDIYAVGSILRTSDRVWRVIEKDNYSKSGLVYYSLEAYVAREKPNDSTLLPENEVHYDSQARPGEEIEITTEDGYFECDIAASYVKTVNKIYLTIPYGISELNVAFKAQGLVKTERIKVTNG